MPTSRSSVGTRVTCGDRLAEWAFGGIDPSRNATGSASRMPALLRDAGMAHVTPIAMPPRGLWSAVFLHRFGSTHPDGFNMSHRADESKAVKNPRTPKSAAKS
jgi:hypothetical protein